MKIRFKEKKYMRFCSECGNQIDDEASVCPKCGHEIAFNPHFNKSINQDIEEIDKQEALTEDNENNKNEVIATDNQEIVDEKNKKKNIDIVITILNLCSIFFVLSCVFTILLGILKCDIVIETVYKVYFTHFEVKSIYTGFALSFSILAFIISVITLTYSFVRLSKNNNSLMKTVVIFMINIFLLILSILFWVYFG